MSLTGWLTDLRLGLATERAARAAAERIETGDGLVRVRALGRYPLHAPARDRSLLPALAAKGRIDPWTGRLIARHLRAGMTVADVGANIGYFTLLMADRVGPRGHVLAFEPNEELCGCMALSLAAAGLADRVTLHPTALGREDGRRMNFVTPGDHLAGSSVWEADRDHPSARPVVTRRLDSIAGAEAIALAKIDAEGSEPAIWEGMAGLLAGGTLRTVLIEYGPANYADPAAFVAAIRAAGFSIAIVDAARGPLAIADAALATIAAPTVVNLLLRR